LSSIVARQKQGRKTMHQAGPFHPAFGAERFGLKDLKSISYNLQAPRLVEDAIRQGEALVAKGGALSAETGVHTGRSPNDKFTDGREASVGGVAGRDCDTGLAASVGTKLQEGK
jgi:Phosphoenolpyruvate carboxykinase